MVGMSIDQPSTSVIPSRVKGERRCGQGGGVTRLRLW